MILGNIFLFLYKGEISGWNFLDQCVGFSKPMSSFPPSSYRQIFGSVPKPSCVEPSCAVQRAVLWQHSIAVWACTLCLLCCLPGPCPSTRYIVALKRSLLNKWKKERGKAKNEGREARKQALLENEGQYHLNTADCNPMCWTIYKLGSSWFGC